MNNIDLVKALHQIWNTGDLALIDSVYAHDFLAHWPASSEVPERRGVEGIHFGVGRIRTAFPDWHEQVVNIFGSGDRVASRYVSTGTHKGAFRRFRFSGSSTTVLSSSGACSTIWQAATTGCQHRTFAQGTEDVGLAPIRQIRATSAA
jgi:hypothetical protein